MNGGGALLVAFVKYILSQLYSHWTWNSHFQDVLETGIFCFGTKQNV